MPRLFLNTTVVETGDRAVVSHPRVGDALAHGLDVESTFGAFSLAQSVHLSARFTYVSPAGLMHDTKNAPWGHLVDGGYFDNSGAVTALDVLGATGAATKPIIIVIRFGKSPSAAPCEDGGPGVLAWAADVVAPVDAVLNARVARGEEAIAALRRQYPDTVTLQLDNPDGESLPLGWMLSAATRGLMDQELDKPGLRCRLAQIKQAVDRGASVVHQPCPL